jgi:hypothetical protein
MMLRNAILLCWSIDSMLLSIVLIDNGDVLVALSMMITQKKNVVKKENGGRNTIKR